MERRPVKKYMIRCDMEGASGVVSYEQAEPGGAKYTFGRAMFMSDLVALLEGLHNSGVEEIVIYDEHYYGRSIDLDRLPRYASAICGKPPFRSDWAGGLDQSFTGVILLGFHSKAGTPEGLLPHSYELETKDLRLNGVSVGEIGIEAAIAGDFGVSVLMVTGDSAGVAEAEALLPGVRCVVVKEALGGGEGRCYPVEVTAERIRSAADDIVRDTPKVAPYRVGPTVMLEIELDGGPYLEAVRTKFSDRMSDEHTLVLKGGNALGVWAEYWQMKLQAQETMEELS